MLKKAYKLGAGRASSVAWRCRNLLLLVSADANPLTLQFKLTNNNTHPIILSNTARFFFILSSRIHQLN